MLENRSVCCALPLCKQTLTDGNHGDCRLGDLLIPLFSSFILLTSKAKLLEQMIFQVFRVMDRVIMKYY